MTAKADDLPFGRRIGLLIAKKQMVSVNQTNRYSRSTGIGEDNMELKHAIFDLDGTLLDSMPVWDSLAGRYLAKNGRQAKPGLRAILSTLAMRGSAEFLIQEYDLDKDADTVMAEMNEMGMIDYRDNVPAKQDAIAYLEALRAKGVKMCVATATDRPLVESALKRLDMEKYFTRVFTCTEVGAGKRQPDIFYVAMEHLGGTKEDTVIFEDSLHAISTAHKYGFRVAAVPDASSAKDEAEIKALAEVWYDTYAQAIDDLK